MKIDKLLNSQKGYLKMMHQSKMSQEEFVLRKIIILMIGLALLLINIAYQNVSVLVSMYSIFVIVILLIKSRNSQPIMFLYVFLLSNSILPFLFFLFELEISSRTLYQTSYHFSMTINYQLLFILSIYFFSKNNYNPFSKRLVDFKCKNNLYLFVLSILVIWFIIIFGKTGTNIFSAGGYGNVNTSGLGGTAIWEYHLIFFIAAYYFSGKKNIQTKIIALSAFSYMFKDLALGGRIATIQLVILLFILYYENYFKNKRLVIYGTIGFVFMVIFAEIRSNLLLSSFGDMLEKFKNPYVLLSNQGEVFYSGTVFIELTKLEFVDWPYRIKSFFGNMISVFLPSKFNMGEAQVAWIASRNLGGTGGGGLISSYFYFWGGPIGVIAIGAYISFLLNNAYTVKNIYFKFYIIMAIVTVMRWHSYNPITLFKSSFYVIPVIFVLLLIHNYKFRYHNYNVRSKIE